MVRVAILGASGYSALELTRLLLRHPQVEITALTTRQPEPRPVGQVHPSLAGRLDLNLENLTYAEVVERADCAFLCLPHGASAAAAVELLPAGLKVVDLSADYRLDDPAVYTKWYGVEHPDATRLAETVYGLPELYRERIQDASLVANPGCYPTSAILALAPLLKAGVVRPDGIIIDSKSGATGAGREPKPHLHFPECNESVLPYGVGTHRHMPEIDLILSGAASAAVEVIFTPHLMPMDPRHPVHIAMPCQPASRRPSRCSRYSTTFTSTSPFVRVSQSLPTTKQVRRHEFLRPSRPAAVRGRVLVTSVIDNLVKGASGAAVQNFNLMYGFPETTALL